MKLMKNLFTLVLLAGLTAFGTQSCSQYKDNDGITLESKTERVANTWKVENYKVNDVDYTSLVTAYTETYTAAGAYSYQWAILGGTATWAFQNSNAEIRITGVNNVVSKTLIILKLEEKSFWYYYMDGTDKYEYHLIPE
jgi:hypothetical protein